MKRSLLLVGSLFLGATSASAQGPDVELPAEISRWMERDQATRWSALLTEGDSIFNSRSCRRCHGDSGVGGRNGPDLTDDVWIQSDGSIEEIRRTIFWGVRRELLSTTWRFEMNPGGGVNLEWNQYSALAAYVWSLSNGTYLPGGD